MPLGEVAGEIFGRFVVAADEVGTERLVGLDRPQPVRRFSTSRLVGPFGKLLVPKRIADLHRQLVREPAARVVRKTFMGDAPCLRWVRARDDTDSRAAARRGLARIDLILGG